MHRSGNRNQASGAQQGRSSHAYWVQVAEEMGDNVQGHHISIKGKGSQSSVEKDRNGHWERTRT